MKEADIMTEVDVAVMGMGMTITRYRNNSSVREEQLDQLRELRLQLEACLGMLENVLPD
jgi:hypothetical protein